MATIEVQVSLADFDDSEIRAEYNARGLADSDSEDSPLLTADTERLAAIYHQLRMGNKSAALQLMHDYLRDRLGTVL